MAPFTWHRWELVVPGRKLALSYRQIAAKFEEKTAQWFIHLAQVGISSPWQANSNADYKQSEY
jgi:hypothetical protein